MMTINGYIKENIDNVLLGIQVDVVMLDIGTVRKYCVTSDDLDILYMIELERGGYKSKKAQYFIDARYTGRPRYKYTRDLSNLWPQENDGCGYVMAHTYDLSEWRSIRVNKSLEFARAIDTKYNNLNAWSSTPIGGWSDSQIRSMNYHIGLVIALVGGGERLLTDIYMNDVYRDGINNLKHHMGLC